MYKLYIYIIELTFVYRKIIDIEKCAFFTLKKEKVICMLYFHFVSKLTTMDVRLIFKTFTN